MSILRFSVRKSLGTASLTSRLRRRVTACPRRPALGRFCKQQREIEAQMIEAFGRDSGAPFRLGKDEGALDDRLGMEREAFGGPIAAHIVFPHRLADIGLECSRMSADVSFARRPDHGMRCVNLLDNGPGEAGEFGQLSGQDRLAEVDIGEQPVAWVCGVMIGRGCEFPARTRVPMRYSRKRQILLALEMVEEASL